MFLLLIRESGKYSEVHQDGFLENLVKLTFVNGFPDQVGVTLQQIPNVLKLDMSDMLGRARILTAKQVHLNEIAAVSVGAGIDNNSFNFASSEQHHLIVLTKKNCLLSY